MLNIVIFGAPGSGKGTQSARIVEKYGLNHISTGDVLRAEIAAGTELGKTAKALIDNGQLIPDGLMISILAAKLDSFAGGKGVIFDGFPRTIAQAEELKKILNDRGQDVNAIYLTVDITVTVASAQKMEVAREVSQVVVDCMKEMRFTAYLSEFRDTDTEYNTVQRFARTIGNEEQLF